MPHFGVRVSSEFPPLCSLVVLASARSHLSCCYRGRWRPGRAIQAGRKAAFLPAKNGKRTREGDSISVISGARIASVFAGSPAV